MGLLEKILRERKLNRNLSKKNVNRIIAITNQKGGVGKSTTAVNVSAYLSSYGYKTLLIDLDPQSNSTSGLGLDPKDVKESVYEVLIHDKDPDRIILNTKYSLRGQR
jgi:chromosome partitioning protein